MMKLTTDSNNYKVDVNFQSGWKEVSCRFGAPPDFPLKQNEGFRCGFTSMSLNIYYRKSNRKIEDSRIAPPYVLPFTEINTYAKDNLE